MTVKSKKFIFKTIMQFSYNLTFAYAIAVALAGKANEITIAGFDGYKKNQREKLKCRKLLI